MFNFISFGSGSSGNCYYFQSEQGAIIVDVGIGIRKLKKYFREKGLSLSSVRAIFVTHDHADHVKAVGVLGNEFRIPVYATKAVHQGMLKNYGMPTKINQEYVRYLDLQESVIGDGFKITSFQVPHDSAENVGYEIVCDGIHFCLITDAGVVTEEMKKYIKAADYLVLEANYDLEMLKTGPYPQYLKTRILSSKGHLCNDDAARVLAENGFEHLKHVWLCHLSEENNSPELVRNKIEAHLLEFGYKEGEDYLLTVLKRKIPSKCYELK